MSQKDARLNTDELPIYSAEPGKEFASHDTVNHSIEEYARFDKETGRKDNNEYGRRFFRQQRNVLLTARTITLAAKQIPDSILLNWITNIAPAA